MLYQRIACGFFIRDSRLQQKRLGTIYARKKKKVALLRLNFFVVAESSFEY